MDPKTQLLTPERDLRSGNDEPTSLDEDFSSARADTDNSVEESSDDSDLEESLKSPRPENLQEMIDEIKKLKEIINSKTFMMKHWRDSAMLLDKEVEALKAKLEAVDKEPKVPKPEGQTLGKFLCLFPVKRGVTREREGQ